MRLRSMRATLVDAAINCRCAVPPAAFLALGYKGCGKTQFQGRPGIYPLGPKLAMPNSHL